MSIHPDCPETYDTLMGLDRLKIFPYLPEPLCTIFKHMVDATVPPNTRCLNCDKGFMNKYGICSEGCDVITQIVNCQNCDGYGFPCINCRIDFFKNTIKSADDS